MKTFAPLALAAALASVLAAPQAHAMLLTPLGAPAATQQITAGASVPANGANGADWTDTLQVQQFNASLGTLNSVSITLSGLIHADFTVTDISGTPLPALFSNQLYGSLTGALPDGSTLELLFEAAEDVKVSSGDNYTGVVVERDGSTVVTLTSGLDAFIGGGSFNVALASMAQSSVTGPGDFMTEVSSWSSADVSVVYDYTAATQNVPEPGALALVGMALAAAALTRRRAA